VSVVCFYTLLLSGSLPLLLYLLLFVSSAFNSLLQQPDRRPFSIHLNSITMLSKSLLSVGLVSLLAVLSNAAPVTKALAVRDNAPKRGLAYNDPNLTSLFGDKASWCYNWGSWKDLPAGSPLEFVPMLHGGGSEFTNIWNTNVEKAISSGSKHILSFNEPDQCG
jgi:hypothetical protein